MAFKEISFSTQSTYEAGNASTQGAVEIGDDKVVVGHKDSSNNLDVTVGTIDATGGFTWGSPQQPKTNIRSFAIAKMEDDRFLIAYSNGADNALEVRVCTVSGTTITLGTPSTVESVDDADQISASILEDGKVVISWSTSASGYNKSVIATSASGTSLSIGTPVVMNGAIAARILDTLAVDSTKFILLYNTGTNTQGYLIAATVTGTVIAFGSAVAASGGDNTYLDGTYSPQKVMGLLDTDKVAYFWKNQSIGYNRVGVATLSGTTITIEDESAHSTGINSDYFSLSVYDTNKFICVGTYPTNGYSLAGEVIGSSTIKVGTPIQFHKSGQPTYINSAYIPTALISSRRAAVIYRDAGDSNKGNAIAGTITDVTLDNFSSGTGSSNSLTISHETGDGQNRLLTVGVSLELAHTAITGVTYNGIALTKKIGLNRSQDNTRSASLWYLVNPPNGTYDVVISYSSTAIINAGVSSFFNVNPDSPVGSTGTNTATGTALSVSITPGDDNAMIVDCAYSPQRPAYSGVGDKQYELYDSQYGAMSIKPFYHNGATTMTMTSQNSANYAYVAMEINGTSLGDTPVDPSSESFLGLNYSYYGVGTDHNSACGISSEKFLVAYQSARVYLKVGTAGNIKSTFGSQAQTASTSDSLPSVCIVDDNKAVLTYHSGGSSLSARRVVTITGTTISLGTDATLRASSPTATDSAFVDINKMVSIYLVSTTLYARIGIVSGTNVTAGGEAVVNSNHTAGASGTKLVSVCAISTSKIAVLYRDATNGYSIRIGTIDAGNSITFGTAVVVSASVGSGTGENVVIKKVDTDKVICVYGHTQDIYAKIATVSGTVPTFGSEQTIYNTTTATNITAAVVADGSFVVTYTTGATDGEQVAGTISGTSIDVLGEANAIPTLSSPYNFEAFDFPSTNKFGMVHRSLNNGMALLGEIGMSVCDRYVESNRSTDLAVNSGGTIGRAQSFTSNGGKLKKIKYYLLKEGIPSGTTMVAKLYAHSGTYGTSSIPTGSPLATSNTVDVASTPDSLDFIDFNFEGVEQYQMTDGSKYCIDFEFTGGDSSNRPLIGADNTSPTHGGNEATSSDLAAWSPVGSTDLIFYALKTGEGVVPTFVPKIIII